MLGPAHWVAQLRGSWGGWGVCTLCGAYHCAWSFNISSAGRQHISTGCSQPWAPLNKLCSGILQVCGHGDWVAVWEEEAGQMNSCARKPAAVEPGLASDRWQGPDEVFVWVAFNLPVEVVCTWFWLCACMFLQPCSATAAASYIHQQQLVAVLAAHQQVQHVCMYVCDPARRFEILSRS